MSNMGIGKSSLFSSCLYTDVDNIREHLTINLISAITNQKKKSNNKDTNTPILTYKNSGYIVFLNDWEN